MRVRPITLSDGRYLIFYEFDSEPWEQETGTNPDPMLTPRLGKGASELRWNPLLGEWLSTATHRQDRTFLPPPGSCPLCPAQASGFPTEVPESSYDVVVLENRFPSLQPHPGPRTLQASDLYPVVEGRGICEVVLYSDRHELSLAQESVEQIYKLILVWTSRYRELSAIDIVKYVFIFENKGEAIGVTLNHPHGQIYGYPCVPPKVARELEQSLAYSRKTSRCLMCDITTEEKRDGRRLVAQNSSWAAYIPFFARWPYEVHISSTRHVQSLEQLLPEEQEDLAGILKQLLTAYDGLFDLSFPYMMVMHQRPSDGAAYDHYHFHVEFYPPMRSASRLKYLAGSETGAGMFVNDTLAEEKAAELRSHVKPVEWTRTRHPTGTDVRYGTR
jgi:UDPglucose--hexose-1-phosphate uridylyltransferase